jgi:chemotaxis methyl-accepting protein methylase
MDIPRQLESISQTADTRLAGVVRSLPPFRLRRIFSLPSRYLEGARSAALAAVAQAAPQRRARIWVPCCKTGGIAYATAMLLSEAAAAVAEPPRLTVFGTDTDEEALEVARGGRYPAGAALGMESVWRARYTDADGESIWVRERVRRACTFSRNALLRDRPPPRVDLLVCQRVFDHIARARRGELLEQFHFALRPGGSLLALDHVDSYIGALFEQVAPGHLVARSASPARRAIARRPTGDPLVRSGGSVCA